MQWLVGFFLNILTVLLSKKINSLLFYMNKSTLYLILFFSLVSYAQSNKLYQKTYTKQDGEAIDNINALYYDNDVLLWIGGSNLDNRSIIVRDIKLVFMRFNGNTFHNIDFHVFESSVSVLEQIYKRKDGQFYILARLNEGYKLLLFNPYTSILNLLILKALTPL